MDGAVESGDRVANEVLYNMYKDDSSIEIDYTKTYYHQRAESKKAALANEKAKKNADLCKSILKYSVAVGVSYCVSKWFNLTANLALPNMF